MVDFGISGLMYYETDYNNLDGFNNKQKMIFGSHNSLTYLTPKTLKMKLLNFHYKCQNKNLIDQIKSGVHVLDIKVRFDEENNLYVTNGKWESKNRYIFDDFINIILDTIRIHRIDNDDMYIYLTLDTDDVFLRQEINFIQFVNRFKTIKIQISAYEIST